MSNSRRGEAIRDFILRSVPGHPGDVAKVVADRFGITRQAANKHLRRLVDSGDLTATGSTRRRSYQVAKSSVAFVIAIMAGTQEDVIWHERAEPLMEGQRQNVVNIAYYAFTEMLNNVIDHSGSEVALVGIEVTPTKIKMMIGDTGIGIFEKVRSALGLEDPRHAILELAKGKFTSDPERHSGQGIFFTSRMCDDFAITSRGLYYRHDARSDDWLIEIPDVVRRIVRQIVEKRHRAGRAGADTPSERHGRRAELTDRPAEDFRKGTLVVMEIATDTDRTPKEVFDRFSPLDAEMEFERTHVPVALARYGNEQLVSRSQAKRVLARFDRFREVMLDFQGIDWIGQAFADEIFRVYRNAHPEVRIIAIGTNEDVRRMIDRASKAT